MYNIPNFKVSPLQKPVSILKQSSFYDEEGSPFHLALGARQVSLPPNSALDTTIQSTLQNTEPSFAKDSFVSNKSKPGAAYKAIITAIPDVTENGRRRAISTVQNFPEVGRRRATSTVMRLDSSLKDKAIQLESADVNSNLPPRIPEVGRGRATTMVKANRSFKERSVALDTSIGNLNYTTNASDLSFSSILKTQNSSRAKSKTLTSMAITPFNSSPRPRQVSIEKRPSEPKRIKNTDPSPTPSIDGRIRLQSLPISKGPADGPATTSKRKFKTDTSKAAKENQTLVSLIGSSDPNKKKRFVKFFDGWLKKVYMYAEEKKKTTVAEEKRMPGRSIDSTFQKQMDRSDKDRNQWMKCGSCIVRQIRQIVKAYQNSFSTEKLTN